MTDKRNFGPTVGCGTAPMAGAYGGLGNERYKLGAAGGAGKLL